MQLLFMTLIVWDIGTGFEIRVFCLTGHIWVWRKSHCSSPIATKFPCFSQLSLETSTHFSYKEVPYLQKSTFPCTSIFFTRNTVIYCHHVPNTLEIQIKTRLNFCKANIPRGYSVLSHIHTLPLHTCTHTHPHTHTIKYNPFDL